MAAVMSDQRDVVKQRGRRNPRISCINVVTAAACLMFDHRPFLTELAVGLDNNVSTQENGKFIAPLLSPVVNLSPQIQFGHSHERNHSQPAAQMRGVKIAAS